MKWAPTAEDTAGAAMVKGGLGCAAIPGFFVLMAVLGAGSASVDAGAWVFILIVGAILGLAIRAVRVRERKTTLATYGHLERWTCAFCGNTNTATNAECGSCGSRTADT